MGNIFYIFKILNWLKRTKTWLWYVIIFKNIYKDIDIYITRENIEYEKGLLDKIVFSYQINSQDTCKNHKKQREYQHINFWLSTTRN